MQAPTLVTASFLAVALSTGALVALAQTTKPPVDANKDGTISSTERRDTNRDGKLSEKERAAAREKAQARFRAADKNRDGGLSREEAKAGRYANIERNFDAMDANRDGKVTPDERRAWAQANRKSSTGSSAAGRPAPASKSSEGGLLPPR